jgi:Cu2+-containing amine oxidase
MIKRLIAATLLLLAIQPVFAAPPVNVDEELREVNKIISQQKQWIHACRARGVKTPEEKGQVLHLYKELEMLQTQKAALKRLRNR